jgi:F0F1-type ATP synthase delta subunit
MKNRLAMGLAATIMATSALPQVMAAPSTNSNSSSNTSGTTSTAKPPKPNPAQALLDNLADKLERDLTEAEAKEIKLALDTAKQQIEAANNKLVSDLASAFALTPEQVKEALKTRAPLVETLAKLVGHKLTSDEIKLLKAAIEAHHKALKASRDELIATISSSTGLTNDEVAEALQPPPPPKPSDKPSDKPSEKPNCKPEGQKGGQQSNQQGGQRR